MIYFITGGQRSGKSRFGQQLALSLAKDPVYLATSRIWDDDHRRRIERHKSDRSDEWTNLEEEKYIDRHDFSGRTVLMDCATLWLTNFFYDHRYEVEKALYEAKTIFKNLISRDFNHLIVISNEIGMGVHPETEAGRKFVDLHGWLNQYIAENSDVAYLMASGIPVLIKGG